MSMTEQFQRAAVVLFAALCFINPLLAEDTPRTANVLLINNAAWQTDLAVVADDGPATVRISDCVGVGAGVLTARLEDGEGVFMPKIAGYQCSGTDIGVIKLPIVSGAPRLWTQATYRDSLGNPNVVVLPPLPDALPLTNDSLVAEYVFDGIENAGASGKAVFLALLPDSEGQTEVELTIYSHRDASIVATETVLIDGFTFYELKTPVDFGRIVVKHHTPSPRRRRAVRSSDADASDVEIERGLFAVALIGDREAGSPRVEVPRARLATSTE